MSLTLWTSDPWEELRQMRREMDRLFNTTLTNFPEGEIGTRRWYPAFDVCEGDREITIHADLPGLKKQDVKVELGDGYLAISGERKCEKKEEKENYRRFERCFGKFYRTFPVPQGLKEDQIKANVEHGVLKITYPKLGYEEKVKSIPVN